MPLSFQFFLLISIHGLLYLKLELLKLVRSLQGLLSFTVFHDRKKLGLFLFDFSDACEMLFFLSELLGAHFLSII